VLFRCHAVATRKVERARSIAAMRASRFRDIERPAEFFR